MVDTPELATIIQPASDFETDPALQIEFDDSVAPESSTASYAFRWKDGSGKVWSSVRGQCANEVVFHGVDGHEVVVFAEEIPNEYEVFALQSIEAAIKLVRENHTR